MRGSLSDDLLRIPFRPYGADLKMAAQEGMYSERDAVLNDPGLCMYCDLPIFAGEQCIILVPLNSPKFVGMLKAYGFHGEECLEGWKRRIAIAGQKIIAIKDAPKEDLR